MPGFTGVISIDVIVCDVTVSVVEPEMVPDEALIVVLPAAMAVANPEALPIVATAVLEELHVTEVVISCVELSE